MKFVRRFACRMKYNVMFNKNHIQFYSRLGDGFKSKTVSNTKNCRIREQQQRQSSVWVPQLDELKEIHKNITNNLQNNNNNNNNNESTYPNEDINCNGCSALKKNKDDINRSRSISMEHQRGTTNVQCHSHCMDEQLATPSGKTVNPSNLHRSRSKTVSTPFEIAASNELETVATESNGRMSTRKNSQVRVCSHQNFSRIDFTDRRSNQLHVFCEADYLNGNNIPDAATRCSRVNNASLRLLVRNRIRPTIKCAQSAQHCTKAATSNATAVNPSMKRGKRTLSSTQIEPLKKHIVLRSVSPLLIPAGNKTKKNLTSAK